ncbi:hypothetical protein Pmani_013205 [Petrolisthes manimaculis]|uniref:Uncharacterized protein n=1 Tax=Petrolisthes manimaculis TaxID=1843537 RepID=A0AAE1UCD9_9EUCA|nr:hypothetical protein Pmani_013205 [Petrolisthes manimaculis]
MTKDFDTLKSERTVARTKATKLVKDLNALWSQKEKADLDDLAYNLSLAENHFTILNSVKGQLHAHVIPDDTHHLSDLDEIIFKSKRLLARLEKAAETRLNAAPHSTCATAKPLLLLSHRVGTPKIYSSARRQS